MSVLKALTKISEEKSNLLKQEAELWRQLSCALTLLEKQFLLPQPIKQEIIIEKPKIVQSGERRLLNERQTALKLSISIHALQRWRRTGKGPEYIKVGRSVRYLEEKLDSFLDSRKYKNTSSY